MEKKNEVGKDAKPEKSIKQKTQDFENIIKEYLESNPLIRSHKKNNELEIRFGTNKKQSRPLSKIDYDNVVKQLYSCGFKTANVEGVQMMRITPESIDPRTGQKKMSIRAEVIGSDLIQEYCRTNSMDHIINMPSTLFNKIKFTRKMTAVRKDGSFIERLNMDEFNFGVSFQTEQDYNVQSDIARNIVKNWNDSLKTFRCMNRVRFYHDELPIFADLSIVKSSAVTENRVPIPAYTIDDAGVFKNMETYEIELEVDNSKVGVGSAYNKVSMLMAALRKTIRAVLSGLQGTKFPISYKEQENVLQEYMKILQADDYKERRVYPSDFIGPSSFTLQLNNIIPVDEKSSVPNIRTHFTVTDKADGDRKLLFVSENGNIYMIDTNMKVVFTGTKTAEKTLFNSIVDGEHIKNDRNGNYINLYAAFDIYFVNKKSVREFPFLQEEETYKIAEEGEEEGEIKEVDESKFRLYLLKQFIDLLKPISILDMSEKEEVKPKETTKPSNFIVKCKTFKATSAEKTIFDGCSEILSNVKDNTYEYNTDGLIFTPSNLAVGGIAPGGPAGKLSKTTWSHSFKWKPPEFNTIDFLVSTKKDKNGKDEIHHIFTDGRNLQGLQEVQQYKTLVLYVGIDPKHDVYMNPFQDILDDNIPKRWESDSEKKYKPTPFIPTTPYDPNACFCNIMLKEDGSKLFMITEEGETFQDDMVVEFKYVPENNDGWKWQPLRVRYDKTAQLKDKKSFGNDYKVANNNWYSIHHPITDEMITSGKDIPDSELDDEVYYNRSNEETSTQGLRDFHNLFVKHNLIVGTAHRGDTLVDLAVGKAGDLNKWISAKLSFVFGIDISKDNIHNQIDGACARYLNKTKENSQIPKAIFINGDSGLNIRTGQAFSTDKDKQVSKAIFGNGPKDATILGKGLIKHYGVGDKGFNITSCQFAIHYFFKNKSTFHQFLRNVAECTKINGYFIGTCYDGLTVFNKLKSVEKEKGITIMKEGRKIYEIIKMYDETGFPDEDMSLGYSINVFQESINQYFREYLVNFNYFIRIMEDYGFVIVKKEEAKHMNLPNGTGMFSELFALLENEVKTNSGKRANYGKATYMSFEEKQISFMNRYFVFKKVRDVDVKKMAHVILKEDELIDKLGEENVKDFEKHIEQFQKEEEIIQKKKERLVLKKEVKPTVTISTEKFQINVKK